jgi:tetratricopeptide (TPR) repeat protein
MEQEEAIRLFFREARRSFPKWGEHLGAEEQSSLAEIAGFMQGHPLAIKLVAVQSTRRSLAGIRDELRQNPPRGVSDRFDVSYNGLDEGQKDLFSRLAVFFGSMNENAIRSICLEEGQSNWESDLEELVRSSFLDRAEIVALDEKGSEVTLYRYRLHPLMRQYAAGKAGDELLDRLRPRAAEYFLDYVRHFRDNFDMLEWERENILAGMDWAVGQQNSSSGESKKAASTQVLEFMSALDGYLDTVGYWVEYHLRLEQAVAATELLEDTNQKSIWIHNLGIISQKKGEYDEARKLYQQSLDILQELGDKSGVARSLHQLGMLAQDTGEYDEARKLYQQSLKIKQELGDKSGVARSLHQLGMLAQDTGEYDEARKLYQQSLEIAKELGDKSGIALSLAQLALLEEQMGNAKVALQLIRQAEAAFLELGSPFAERARKVRERIEKNQ